MVMSHQGSTDAGEQSINGNDDEVTTTTTTGTAAIVTTAPTEPSVDSEAVATTSDGSKPLAG